jgi:hypothetical protein
MKTLEFKIFDVLTERITVSDFENWLYSKDEILSNLNTNSYYFELISIDYSAENWAEKLHKLTKKTFDDDFVLISNLLRSCIKINETNDQNTIYQILNYLLNDFDYDTDYKILWDLYWIKDQYESFNGTLTYKKELIIEVKEYMQKTLVLIKKTSDFKSIKKALLDEI